jgi:hypothetical protein
MQLARCYSFLEHKGGVQEYEDDAQRLAMLELDGNLVVRDIERLARVDRALRTTACRTSAVSSSGENDSRRFQRRSLRWLRKRRMNRNVRRSDPCRAGAALTPIAPLSWFPSDAVASTMHPAGGARLDRHAQRLPIDDGGHGRLGCRAHLTDPSALEL